MGTLINYNYISTYFALFKLISKDSNVSIKIINLKDGDIALVFIGARGKEFIEIPKEDFMDEGGRRFVHDITMEKVHKVM